MNTELPNVSYKGTIKYSVNCKQSHDQDNTNRLNRLIFFLTFYIN